MSLKVKFILAGALTVIFVAACLVYRQQVVRAKAAEAQALIFLGREKAALDAETQAKTEKSAAQQLVEAKSQRVAELEAALAKHPAPPPAQPVPVDASAADVVAGLQGLGIHPNLLEADPAIGLNLPDGRTVLGWGRQALRLPQLDARMGALEDLSKVQTEQAQAMNDRAARADEALAAADARAVAATGRADSLQTALNLSPKDRPWSVTAFAALDTTGARHLGAGVSRAWGPVHVDVIVLGNMAAVGGGVRF